MHMNRIALALLFALLTLPVFAADAPSTPLTDEQIDKTFDEIFAQQQKITRMQAKVVTSKKGGIFNKLVQSTGYAYAQMPDRLLFVDYGENTAEQVEAKAAIILIDGFYLWDLKPGENEGAFDVERLAMKSAGDRDINIAALLIGADVKTGKQLREFYALTGSLDDLGAAGKSYQFNLKTLPGKEKQKRKEDVVVWIRPGEVIPWKIHSLRYTPKSVNPLQQQTEGETQYKVTESTKEISELQTNLSNPPLTPFAPERFFFGEFLRKYPASKVQDGRGQELDKATLQQELDIILSRLKGAAPAGGTPPPSSVAPAKSAVPGLE